MGRLPQGRRDGDRARRHDGRAGAGEAERGAAAAADPDRAGARLDRRLRRRDQELRERATDGEPVVGSGPFRLVEGTAGGSTYRFEVNPDYWGGAPHIDEVVFRVFKSEDPAIQALIKGEVDFVEGINALQVEALEGREGITAQMGDSPGFDEIAFNTGSIDTETGEPHRRPEPGGAGPGLPVRARLRDRPGADRRERPTRAPARRATRSSRPPTPDFRWEPPEEDAFTYDPERAARAARRGRLHGRRRRLADDAGRHPIGTLRLYARSDSADIGGRDRALLGVARRPRHRLRGDGPTRAAG